MSENSISFEDLLCGLSENFGAIYLVDFDNDEVIPYRMSPQIEEYFGDYFASRPPYEDAINSYIYNVVSPKDQEAMYVVTRIEHLKEQLKNSRAFTHEYRLERGGKEYVYRFKVANLGETGELHKAVIGFADVSSENVNALESGSNGKKILLVESDMEDRDKLVGILESKYEVLVSTNISEAKAVLKKRADEIALVVTDIHMPDENGYELIKTIKRDRKLNRIPIIVASDRRFEETDNEIDMEDKCLKMGVSDFFYKPYSKLVILNRVAIAIGYKMASIRLGNLERDLLTGLLTKEFFFEEVEKYISDYPGYDYILWVSDIEGLKIINDNHGFEMGDSILKQVAREREKVDGYLFGGRFDGDKFAALMLAEALPEIKKITNKSDMGIHFPVPNVVIKSGIYRLGQKTRMNPQGMYDRAVLAMQKIKPTYGVYFAEYNDEDRKELLIKRLVVDNAEVALDEKQFVVYYQPKYDIDKGTIGGAEALVRWLHPELGFVDPGTFIPVFEKNGFIGRLDYYVWETVCQNIKQWEKDGFTKIPISVNVSLRDFDDENLAEKIISLVDKYEIEHHLFHVEITESAYSDNPQRIISIANKLHDAGFIIELDDFGTGYSSLTALTEIPIDIMKLDMSIIRKDDPNTEKSVLAFSMQLAQIMKMKTVAEGVETKAQLNRIKFLGGNYVQGYYFSKPLTKVQFEDYMKKNA